MRRTPPRRRMSARGSAGRPSRPTTIRQAWVRTVGYRLCLNRWRKARNRLMAHRRHGTAAEAAPPSDDTVTLVDALRRLPVAEREAIVLHHLLDLPVAEVA